MALQGTHFYLVKDKELIYPREFHAQNAYMNLSFEHQFTRWGFWLPFTRNAIAIEALLEHGAYTQDSQDVHGIMLDHEGNGIWVEISGKVMCVIPIIFNEEFDVKSSYVGVPDVFKTIHYIKPKIKVDEMLNVATKLMAFRTRSVVRIPLDELRTKIKDSPKCVGTLGDFMANLRDFHAKFSADDHQYCEKFKLTQSSNLNAN